MGLEMCEAVDGSKVAPVGGKIQLLVANTALEAAFVEVGGLFSSSSFNC